MGVEFTAQFQNLPLEPFELHLAVFTGGGKAAKLLDIFLEALDFLLSIDRRRALFVFVGCGH
jgi:hypothetical protein